MTEVAQYGPWASVLVAIFAAWVHIVMRLTAMEVKLQERKDDVDRRLVVIEERLSGLQSVAEVALMARLAEQERSRMWEAIKELQKS